MVVPIFLISWVAMLAIIVPESSGEKIGFCVAIDLGLIFLKASLNADLSAPLKNQSQGFKFNPVDDTSVRIVVQESLVKACL